VEIIQVDIVGGSISGLSAAIALKEHNPSIIVVVHEKYKMIGYNHEGRRCGEAHTVDREWKKWKPTKASVFNTIANGDVTIGKNHYHVNVPAGTGFILNRQEFICQLAREAEKKGVVLQTEDKITSLDDLAGDYVIDASGCPSTIKRLLGIGKGVIGTTYQQTIQDANCFVADTVKIIFTSEAGYFWIFPRDAKKKEVNVGVGMLGDFGCNLRTMLERFKEEHSITGTVNYVVGGRIPLGLQRPFSYKNILFVGDAGVGAFPLSGQGIYRALMSGEIAGRCLATNHPEQYPWIIRREFLEWDIIGVTFIKMNVVLRKINPGLFFTTMNMMSRSGGQFGQLIH